METQVYSKAETRLASISLAKFQEHIKKLELGKDKQIYKSLQSLLKIALRAFAYQYNSDLLFALLDAKIKAIPRAKIILYLSNVFFIEYVAKSKDKPRQLVCTLEFSELTKQIKVELVNQPWYNFQREFEKMTATERKIPSESLESLRRRVSSLRKSELFAAKLPQFVNELELIYAALDDLIKNS